MWSAGPDTALGALRQTLAAARRAVVFTGAGISTESGIPDFRSPSGIWERYRPIDFREFMESPASRREYWTRKFDGHETITSAQPNRGHEAVAELVRRGAARVVITQNIDGLHQKAGVPAERVIELHGNGTYAACLECGAHHALEPIREAFLTCGALPVCRACGGIVKTATISFGQAMPVEAMRRAEDESRGCDLFLCVGSSLVVYPAAGLPVIAKRSGARLVILNRDPTDLDRLADQVLNREIGETLAHAVAGVEP